MIKSNTMFFQQKTEPQKVIIEIESPGPNILPERFAEFRKVLEQINVIQMISERTGLFWKQPKLIIKSGEEAMWEGLDTVIVEYNRGIGAVSSLVHEAFHVMLRQIEWTKHPVVVTFFTQYPDSREIRMNSKGYTIEQMFAYLLQNEIYIAIAKQLHVDITKEIWGKDHFNWVLDLEYDTSMLRELGKTIIEVWNNTENRSTDIFNLIEDVRRKLINNQP